MLSNKGFFVAIYFIIAYRFLVQRFSSRHLVLASILILVSYAKLYKGVKMWHLLREENALACL